MIMLHTPANTASLLATSPSSCTGAGKLLTSESAWGCRRNTSKSNTVYITGILHIVQEWMKAKSTIMIFGTCKRIWSKTGMLSQPTTYFFCIPALALLRARATTTHSTAAIRAIDTTGSTAMMLSSAAFHVGACPGSGWDVSTGSRWDVSPGSRGCSSFELALGEGDRLFSTVCMILQMKLKSEEWCI